MDQYPSLSVLNSFVHALMKKIDYLASAGMKRPVGIFAVLRYNTPEPRGLSYHNMGTSPIYGLLRPFIHGFRALGVKAKALVVTTSVVQAPKKRLKSLLRVYLIPRASGQAWRLARNDDQRRLLEMNDGFSLHIRNIKLTIRGTNASYSYDDLFTGD